MSDSPNIAMLHQVSDDLTAHLAGLSAEQLAAPSACEGWDISQVLAHLGAALEGMTATISAAATGGEGPPPEFRDTVRAQWEALSPEERRDGVIERSAALVALLEGADPSLAVTMGFAPMPLPVDMVAGFLIIELAFHAWDVRVPFDPGAHLFPPAVPVLAQLLAGFTGRMSAAGKLEGNPTVTIELDDAQESFGLLLGDPLQRVDAPSNPDAVLKANTEDWLLFMTGRTSQRPVDVSGALDVADLRKVFAGV